MALGNTVWSNPDSPNLNHHTEETYKELSEMGFNCVRFYLNYSIIESDSRPYSYKESGFEWLDRNIEWAKKYDMGIIFNMHYPQGGYQSLGEGMTLWTDEKSRDRLTALWKAIAERYSDEPTVWGYGIINEPYVPQLGTYEESAQQYFGYADELTKAIRSVSPYQAVFVEKLCGIMPEGGGDRDWTWFTTDNTMQTVSDDNVIYEFHFYDPFTFTHQGTSWTELAGTQQSYPSDEIAAADYESNWAGCIKGTPKEEKGGWTYFETTPQTADESRNIVSAALHAPQTGSGAVFFDDIAVKEISADGTERVLLSYDFNSGGLSNFYSWSSDGTGETVFSEEGRSGGCIKIIGTAGDYTVTGGKLIMKEGCSYVVSGYVRKADTTSSASVRIDFAKADNIRLMDKSYLESLIEDYARWGTENNAPLYMGEFGVVSWAFGEGAGGAEWVRDVIDLCFKYGIGFNYHAYHEQNFGMYKSSDMVRPNEKDLNTELAEVFKDCLAN